jgi:hypothetical protein
MDAPGDDPTGLHDQVLCLMGDILPHQYPFIEVPSTAFHLVGTAVRVPTVAAMAALLPAWDVAANQTEVIRPRYTQLIPTRYAALLVHRKPIRPKQAYEELVSAILA